jgi:hypothetical protein
MNKLLPILAVLAAAPLASAEYSVFRVCEDQHVIKTADGAEAGHVEYIVLEPSSRRIVSTVVTGGVIGGKLVAVPFESMQFGTDRTVTLTEINRERLVSAPVIERTEFAKTSVIQPTVIDRTYNHFGVRINSQADVNVNTTNRATTTGGQRETTSARTEANTRSTTTDRQTTDAQAGKPQPPKGDQASERGSQRPPPVGEKMDRNQSSTDRGTKSDAQRQSQPKSD